MNLREQRPSQSLAGTDAIIAAALFTVALVIRLWHLGDRSLWNDEMFSLQLASLPLGDIQGALVEHYHHPPLFFYLDRVSVLLFGPTTWALRFPSALAGALTVPLLFFAGRRLEHRNAGLIAAMLCLAAPFHVAYSQEGRPYALAALLCLISFASFLRLRQERRLAYAAVYTVSTLLLLYTHHWGIFAVAAQIVTLLLTTDDIAADLRSFALPLGLIGLLYLPESIALGRQANAHGAAGWFWVEHTSLLTLVSVALAYAGSYFKFAASVFQLPAWLQIVSGLLAALLIILIAIRSWSREARLVRSLASICGIFLLIPIALSLARPEVFVWYRYPVIAFPALCLLAGTALWDNRWKTALVGLLLAVQFAGLAAYAGWEKGNAKAVAAYVDTVATGDEAMIIRPKEFAPLLNYYYRGTARQYDEAYLNQPLGQIIDTARGFVYVSIDVPNEIRAYIDGHFDKLAERKFPAEAHMGMIVGVYRQKPDEPDTTE